MEILNPLSYILLLENKNLGFPERSYKSREKNPVRRTRQGQFKRAGLKQRSGKLTTATMKRVILTLFFVCVKVNFINISYTKKNYEI